MPSHSIPGPRALWRAVRELTFLPGAAPADMGASAFFYPLIGVSMGGAAYLFDRWTQTLLGIGPSSVAVVLLVAALSGLRPQRDFSRVVAALLRGQRSDFLARAGGGASWPVVGLTLLLEVWLVAHLDRLRPVGLLFAPALGVWSMVVLGFGSRAARADGRRGKFAEQVTFTEFAIASVATFAFVFWLTQFLGIVLVCAAAMATMTVRLTLHARLDGVPHAALGATWQLVALVTLAVLAAF